MSETGKSDNSAFYLRILVLLALMAAAGGAGLWMGKRSVPEETLPLAPSGQEPLSAVPTGGKPAPPAAVPAPDPSAPPVFFYAHPQNEEAWATVLEEVAMASEANIHQYIVPVELTWSEEAPAADPLAVLKRYITADPKATFFVQVSVNPDESWRKAHGSELMVVNGAAQPYPSASSQQWMEDARGALTRLMESVEGGEVSRRIAGYVLRGLVDDQWMQPSGYDRSEVNRQGFRDWLIRRYQTDEGLGQAWQSPDLKAATVDIPAQPDTGSAEQVFFPLPGARPTVDFLQYTSEIAADALAAMASHVAATSAIKPVLLAYYGYSLELTSNAAGHFALANLLESNVDGFISPISSVDRGLGVVCGDIAAVHSISSRGKKWFVVDDTRTGVQHDAETGQFSRMRGVRAEDIFDVQRRNFSAALVNGLGVVWCDPDGEGWLHDKAQFAELGRMAEIYAGNRPSGPGDPAGSASVGVNVVVDENSRFYQQCDAKLNTLLVNGSRDAALRAGVPTRFVLLRDVIEGMAPPAPVYLFANAFRLSGTDRAALHDRLGREKACAIWLYAPGYLDELASDENLSATAGMTVHSFGKPERSSSTFRLPGQFLEEGAVFGADESWNPLFYVEDADADVLAQYKASGKASVAVKPQASGWTSVYVAEPAVPPALLCELLRILEQPMYEQPGDANFYDAVYAGGNLVAIHGSQAGKRTIALGAFFDVQDLFDAGIGWVQKEGFLLPLRPGETRLFTLKPI